MAGGGFTYFLTLNGPGENEHKQWVQVGGAGVKRLPQDRPICGCNRVWDSMQKGDWNKRESACWNRLRLALSRLAGTLTYIGSVETQKRGVLHRHIVIHVAVPLTAAEVGDLALAAGYGCVHDLQLVRSAAKAAYYISKYVMKSAGDRGDVPWRAEVFDEVTGEVRLLHTRPTFRTWSAARSWGYTLRGLRDIARAQAAARSMYLRELENLLAPDTDSPQRAPATSDPPA